MREIKFRAWQTQYKEMHQPLYGYIEFPDIVVGFSDGDLRLDKDDVILQQFTGLKDKNGKEIYDGDLLKYGGVINEVKYIKELCIYDDIFGLGFASLANECEVIGNIFENPELINHPLT